MSTNVVNSVAYLRTSREFPVEDIKQLAADLGKSYIDTASCINVRVIGIFSTNRPSITGKSWFITSTKQESFRQIYTFTSTAANIAHGINLAQIDRFAPCSGKYTDGTNWYGLIDGSPTPIPGQISFYVSPTEIVFVVDGAAPTLTQGLIVLEWLSRP